MQKIISKIPIKLAYYAPHALKWRKILKKLKLNLQKDVVVEIAPGWAPKIIMALHELNFQGEYIGIDYSQEALDTLELMSKMISLKFKVTTLVPNQVSKIKNRISLIVANHVLDDFILRNYLQKNKLTQHDVFTSNEKLKKSWHEISKKENYYIQSSATQLTFYLDELATTGTKSLISQYPAYLEKLYKLDNTTKISLKAFSTFSKKIMNNNWTEKPLPINKNSLNKNYFRYFTKS